MPKARENAGFSSWWKITTGNGGGGRGDGAVNVLLKTSNVGIRFAFEGKVRVTLWMGAVFNVLFFLRAAA